MVWSARPDGAIDYYNRRWYEFTGLSKAREDDEKWPTILHPDDVERTLELWQEAMRTGNVFETEHRFRDRRTGEFRWHLARALPMHDRSGRITRWFGTSTDIDDLKQAQDALVDASRRKDEFLAMLGHELRNPLSAVVNAMSLLSLPDLSADEAGQARLIVQRQLQNMTRLIDDLLDVARVTRGKITLQSEVVDLQALMQRVISTVGPLIEARQHRLETSLPAERVRLLADPTRIEQVLNNLLNNAAKYTEAGGHIWLSAVRLGDKVEICVRDDGLGMNPETLARAFDLFSQAERSLDRSQGGLGIGLTMVKSLVSMHGGEVRATATAWDAAASSRSAFPSCRRKKSSRKSRLKRGCTAMTLLRLACCWLRTISMPRSACGCCSRTWATSSRPSMTAPPLWPWPPNSGRRLCCSTSACRKWTAMKWRDACERNPTGMSRSWSP